MIAVAVIVGLAVTVTGLIAARLFRPPMDWPDIPDDYDQAMDERIACNCLPGSDLGTLIRNSVRNCPVHAFWEPWMNDCDPDWPCGTHWDNDADRAVWETCARHQQAPPPPPSGRHHRKQSAGHRVPIASITDLTDRRQP